MSESARIQSIPSYVSLLRSVSGLYLGYIPNKYADTVSENDYYGILESDPTIAHVIGMRALMTVGERVEIEHKDKRLVHILKMALQQIPDFLHAQKSLAEKGILYGLGIQRKFYRSCRLGDLPGTWQCVYRLQEVDRRRLRIERDLEDRTKTSWTIYDLALDSYKRILDRALVPNLAEGDGLQDYVWYIHSYEETSPYFRGIGDNLFSLGYIKSKCMQYWADLAESWSKPFLTFITDIMNMAMDAQLGQGFATKDEIVARIIEKYEKVRARHMAVVDARDKVEWHEHGSSGNNIIRELIEYCDRRIEILGLGAELTTQSAATGSYAQASIHRQATDSIIVYDRVRLASVIAEHILYDFCVRNARQLRIFGVGQPAAGSIHVKFIVEQEELKKQEMQKQQSGRNYPSQSRE